MKILSLREPYLYLSMSVTQGALRHLVTRTVSLLVLREIDWRSDPFKKSILGDPDQSNVGIAVSNENSQVELLTPSASEYSFV